MFFKRGKNRLTTGDSINSNNIKDKFSTLFNPRQALIRIYFLLVSFEKFVEKLRTSKEHNILNYSYEKKAKIN